MTTKTPDTVRNIPPNSNYYETPAQLWDRLHAEFDFDIDAFADRDNAKCPIYFTAAGDPGDDPGGSAFDHEWEYHRDGSHAGHCPPGGLGAAVSGWWRP